MFWQIILVATYTSKEGRVKGACHGKSWCGHTLVLTIFVYKEIIGCILDCRKFDTSIWGLGQKWTWWCEAARFYSNLCCVPNTVSQEKFVSSERYTSTYCEVLLLLLLLLSRFSGVRLCATPWTAACQAPLSLGFSRQEHWSGLPFPSPGITTTRKQTSNFMNGNLFH